MRILFVVDGFPPAIGGVERLFGSLAQGLVNQENEVEVITKGGPSATTLNAVASPLKRGELAYSWAWRVSVWGPTWEEEEEAPRKGPPPVESLTNLRGTTMYREWT